MRITRVTDLLHLTADRKTTVCGQDCSNWEIEHTPFDVQDAVDKGFNKTCKRCGQMAHFQDSMQQLREFAMSIVRENARREYDAKILARSRASKRHQLSAMLTELIQDSLQLTGDPEARPRSDQDESSFFYRFPDDNDKYTITLQVTSPSTTWTPAYNDAAWVKQNEPK
jgi:hypothetical protein